MSFDDDLDAQIAQKTEDPETVTVDVAVNGKLRTLRFTQMDGLDWADQTDRFPARPGVLLDMRYGYNLRPLSKAVAKISGVLLEDGNPVVLTPEQWDKLFKGAPGSAVMRIGDAVFNLNEYLPGEAVKALKKGSAAVSALNSELPASSESPTAS